MLHVAQSPNFEVKFVRSHFFDKFNVDVPYPKAWRERNELIEAVYGNWDKSYQLLPRFLRFVKDSNPGTITAYSSADNTCNASVWVFDRVFWAVGPCIKAWADCL